MADNTMEDQPAVTPEAENLASSSEDARPETKASVRINHNPVLASARFVKGDRVHKPVFANGVRTKHVYSIYNARLNPKGWVEYQLMSMYTMKVESGWHREKDLKAGG